MFKQQTIMTIAIISTLIGLVGCGNLSQSTDNTQSVASSSHEVLNYFYGVAFGSEYGSGSLKVKKWTRPIKLKLLDDVTEEDLHIVSDIIAELNAITGAQLNIQLTTNNDYNLGVHIIPQSEFTRYNPNAIHANGWVSLRISGSSHIKSGTILIAKELEGDLRQHVIREEITQALGILKDSWERDDSIFYQGYSTLTNYSSIDIEVIKLLYQSDIQAGMTLNQVQSLLDPS
ncbi:hypothetical protein DID77_01165 [Candidatus Marinamargulisbacteria bacterium SCGC AG-439-L15]|nr:hypothetical protein DID77_01165 [Candidatus Marinamargulisbacteria bacterium SCGC AG-439-L15]